VSASIAKAIDKIGLSKQDRNPKKENSKAVTCLLTIYYSLKR